MTMFPPSPPHSQQVAWITGASSGIGRALALGLAARGYVVIATARREKLLLALVEEAKPALICSFPGDATDLVAMRDLLRRAEAEIGPIKLAIINAGFHDLRENLAFDAAVAWKTIDSNLGTAMRCCDAVLPAMLRRGGGHIVFVASLAAYGGVPGSAAYCAAKSGLIRFAEALRLRHRPDGIAIQVVNPGFVRTAMTAGHRYPMPWMISAEAAADKIISRLGRGFEIVFPWQLAAVCKLAALLPYRLWFVITGMATRRVAPFLKDAERAVDEKTAGRD